MYDLLWRENDLSFMNRHGLYEVYVSYIYQFIENYSFELCTSPLKGQTFTLLHRHRPETKTESEAKIVSTDIANKQTV
jgi:hypothetical protein